MGFSPELRVKVCALSALCALWVEVCALSALSALIPRGGDLWVLDFGPEGCGPSPLSGGGCVLDEAEGFQLFESEVDALLAYMAVEEGPDLGPG